MISLNIDGIDFAFDDDWKVEEYDRLVFYRNRFQGIIPGLKAVDIVALAPDRTMSLIEVKDYRGRRRTKPSELHEEVAAKVVWTLSALLPMAHCTDLPAERDFARAALASQKIDVVLHLEQGATGSRLFPRRYKPEDVALKLRQRLKAIDRRAKVTDRRSRNVAWSCP